MTPKRPNQHWGENHVESETRGHHTTYPFVVTTVPSGRHFGERDSSRNHKIKILKHKTPEAASLKGHKREQKMGNEPGGKSGRCQLSDGQSRHQGRDVIGWRKRGTWDDLSIGTLEWTWCMQICRYAECRILD